MSFDEIFDLTAGVYFNFYNNETRRFFLKKNTRVQHKAVCTVLRCTLRISQDFFAACFPRCSWALRFPLST